MIICVAMENLVNGQLRVTAPDLPDCIITDNDKGRAFARIRLEIERRLADLLLAGQTLPQPQLLDRWRSDPRLAGLSWYEAHINVRHLEAVARHQRSQRTSG